MRLTTPYSLGILIWNFYQTFVIVSIEFWMRLEPQIRSTIFAINFLIITATTEKKVCFCVKLFNFFSRWILIRLTSNFSCSVPNSVKILTWNFRKKLFRENFSEILYKPRLPLPKLVKFHHSFCNFILVRIALKKFTQLLSYIVCTYVRRQFHKQITKRRCGEEKPGRFVFKNLVLFTLTLGLITPYSLGILVWNFYQTFVIVSIEFWLRLEPQIRSTRFAIKFLFITVTAEKKVCLCVNLFYCFPRWILICLTWNLSCFVPNLVKILTWNFRKKLFRETFSEILYKPRLSSIKTSEISP